MPIVVQKSFPRLTEGACERSCTLMPFLVAIFFVTAATSSAQTPAVITTMSSVEPSERPLALGVQFLFYRTLAYIPTPIYFGRIIDAACALRQPVDHCSGERGACELYDADTFRHIYFGLAIIVKLVGLTFMLFCLRATILRDNLEQRAVDDKSLQRAPNSGRALASSGLRSSSPLTQVNSSNLRSTNLENSNIATIDEHLEE